MGERARIGPAPADEISRLRERVAELEWIEQERKVLARLTARAAAAASAAELMDAICEETERLLQWDCFYLARRTPGKAPMHVERFVDTEDGRKRAFPGEDVTPENTGPALRRALAGEALLLNRDHGEAVPSMVPFGTGRLSASLLFVPVRCADAVSGVLSVQSYTPGRYDRTDLQCLQRIAEAIAPALERVHAEDRLRQSEARHRTLVEQIPAITYTADADGNLTYISPQVEAILGHTPADYTSAPEHWRRHLHPDDRDRVLAELARCRATGAPFAGEYRAVARDGRVVWFRDAARVIRDEAGQPLCLQGVMLDITEQKHADHLLRLQRDLAIALSRRATLLEAMRCVLDAAVSIDGIECGAIYLAGPAAGEFHLIAHRGLSAAFVAAVSHIDAESSEAWSMTATKPLYASAGQPAEQSPACDAEGLQALAILPVAYDGRVVAVMQVASRSCREIPAAARPVLEAIAVWIGAVIERVRSEEALEKARDELERRVEARTAELRAANEALRREIAERKAAQDERDRILDMSRDLICIAGMDGYFKYVNPAWEKTLGYTREELLSRPFLSFIHPDDHRKNDAEVARLASGRPTVDFENRYIHKDGTVRVITWTATPVPEKGLAYCIGRDITERRRIEASLRRSETLLRTISDNLPSGMIYQVVRNRDGSRTITYVSEGVRRLYGVSPEEAKRDSELLYGRIHPEDRLRFRQEEEEANRTFSVFRTEARIIGPSGHIRWSSFVSSPRRLEDGSVCWDGIELDITDRKRTEDALRESEEAFRLAFEHARDAIFWADAQTGILLKCNEAAELLLDRSREEIIGQHQTVLHPLEKTEFYASLFRNRDQRARPEGAELEVVRKDGTRVPVHVRSSVTTINGRRVVQGIFRDITDRKRAEAERQRLSEQLREAQKLEAIGRFGRGLAHEFNNLMATVLGLASRMRANRRPDDPDYANLVHIEDAARAAGDLAHQLLSFARGGKIRPFLLPFADVLRTALVLVPPMLRPEVTMERDIAPDLWHVHCDQTQIQQVIANLCRNAVEAMPNGGRLTIRAENRTLLSALDEAQPPLAPGDYVCLSVEDTGCGMDARTMARIFDPFFTTKEHGHGLGLAAAHGVMAAHQGAISARSQPGKGSTFCIWLPRAKPSADRRTVSPA